MLHASLIAMSLAPLGTAESLTDGVARAMCAAVQSGELVPGRLYSAYQLADRLGVSRSPVREALLRLAEVGLVRFERNRGFRVLLPQPRDIAEVFAVRLALEVPAAHRAAASATPELVGRLRAALDGMAAAAAAGDAAGFMRHDVRLHDELLAGNRRAAGIVAGLRDVTRLIGASTAEESRTLADIRAEHEPVVAAVEARDGEAAAAALAEHITNTGRLLVAQALRVQPSPAQDADALWSDVVG